MPGSVFGPLPRNRAARANTNRDKRPRCPPTVRAVFIGDPRGKVRLVIYYPQEIGRNMDEILRAVKALQLSDSKGVAVPANWPNNDLIKDHVIIPPANNVKDAEARKNQEGCYDWWFCHKAL